MRPLVDAFEEFGHFLRLLEQPDHFIRGDSGLGQPSFDSLITTLQCFGTQLGKRDLRRLDGSFRELPLEGCIGIQGESLVFGEACDESIH